jgi:hypothetical protein
MGWAGMLAGLHLNNAKSRKTLSVPALMVTEYGNDGAVNASESTWSTGFDSRTESFTTQTLPHTLVTAVCS